MVKLGDIFTIEIDNSRFGSGLVAGIWKQELYVVVYNVIWPKDEKAFSLDNAEILLAALTLDAKFFHGDWKVVGSDTALANTVPQPCFKVEEGGRMILESRDRKFSREASKLEAETLSYRTVVAPVRIENALKAHYGIGEWVSRYDDLLAEHYARSANIL